MKKVYLLGTILAATVAHGALADAPGVAVGVPAPQAGCPKAFEGFYLGGNIGAGFNNGKLKRSHTAQSAVTVGGVTTTTITDTDTHSHRVGGAGVDGGIGVGYNRRLCNWLVGIAFDANWAGASGKSSETITEPPIGETTTFSTKARLRNSLQLYARFGYVMREIAMPFIGLGWDNSQWKQSTTNNFTRVAPGTPLANLSRTISKSKRFNAFLWKLGVDFLATKHVIVGFEYTGTVAGNKSATRTFVNTLADGSVRTDTHRISFKPQYNKFALTAKIIY